MDHSPDPATRPLPGPPGGARPDPMRTLDSVADRPLAEQVAVFQAVHDHLSAQLARAED